MKKLILVLLCAIPLLAGCFLPFFQIFYDLTFDANGASGSPPAAQKYKAGATVTFPGKATLAKAGFHFVGWREKADGTGVLYEEDDTMVMPSKSFKVYAQWVADVVETCWVHYYANGADSGSAPPDEEIEVWTEFTVAPKGSLAKERYEFTGWSESPTGEGASYEYPEKFMMPDHDIDLYAQWEEVTPATFDLVYLGNGNTAGDPPATAAYEKDDMVTVADKNTLVKDQYAFMGWDTVAGGGGTFYEPDDQFLMPDHDVTLYAQWAEIIRVLFVSAGHYHTMILLEDGTLLGTGRNTVGQLGDGSYTTRTKPVKIMENVIDVSAGAGFTLILTEGGHLYATGSNDDGQLGTGDATSTNTPVFIMSGVRKIAAGGSHSLIIKSDAESSLWSVGENDWGQLACGSNQGPLYDWQFVMNGVADVKAGTNHTLILTEAGDLYTAGKNLFGELGTGDQINRIAATFIRGGVSAISAGEGHSLFLVGGDLYGMGHNSSGQLGLGVNDPGSMALSPTFIVSNVDGISAGLAHSLFTRATDNSLWAMGDNTMLQLGDGSSLNRYSPVQVGTSTDIVSAGYDHSMFIAPDATLWTAGDNRYGQMGLGSKASASPWKRVNIEGLGL